MRLVKASKKSQSGQAIIMFTLMVASVLIPMVGLAIDGGRGYLVRLKLSSAVDSGALAAARLLGTGSNATQQLANAQSTAQQFVAANFPAGFFGANLSGQPNVCIDPGTDSSDPCRVGSGQSVSTYKVRTVSVQATAQMPTLFMRIIGMPTVTVSSSGVASRRDVRVVVALDRSSSMSGYFGSSSNSINNLALQFVKSFSGSGDLGGRDEVGRRLLGHLQLGQLAEVAVQAAGGLARGVAHDLQEGGLGAHGGKDLSSLEGADPSGPGPPRQARSLG